MNLPHIRILAFFAFCFSCCLSTSANAVVAQSASSALRSDTFVGNDKNTANEKALNAAKKKLQKEAAEKKAKAQKEREKLARQALEQAKGNMGTVSTKSSNLSNTLDELTNSMSKSVDAAKDDDETRADAPYVNANKHYAAKLFSSLSGHITIEEKNIPKKISVTKGSTIQLNLQDAPETEWFFSFDKSKAKIIKNTVSGNQRIVIFETIDQGRTKIVMDYLSTKPSDYKVLLTKKMVLLVD